MTCTCAAAGEEKRFVGDVDGIDEKLQRCRRRSGGHDSQGRRCFLGTRRAHAVRRSAARQAWRCGDHRGVRRSPSPSRASHAVRSASSRHGDVAEEPAMRSPFIPSRRTVGSAVGDTTKIVYPDDAHKVTVSGIFTTDASQAGAIIIARARRRPRKASKQSDDPDKTSHQRLRLRQGAAASDSRSRNSPTVSTRRCRNRRRRMPSPVKCVTNQPNPRRTRSASSNRLF